MVSQEKREIFCSGDARIQYGEKPVDMMERALGFEQLAHSGKLENPMEALAHAMRILDYAIKLEAYLTNHNL